MIDIKWQLGRVLCKLGPSLQTTYTIVSAFSILTIAVDRWKFIVHHSKNFEKKRCLIFNLAFIWAISIVVSIPCFIVFDLKTIKVKQTDEILYSICEEHWSNSSQKYVYMIVVILVQYVLPVVMIASSYKKIYDYLQMHLLASKFNKSIRMKKSSTVISRNITNNNLTTTNNEIISLNLLNGIHVQQANNQLNTIRISANSKKLRDDEKSVYIILNRNKFSKSKRFLCLLSISFAIFWLPLLVLNAIIDYNANNYFSVNEISILYLTCHLIALSSCALNPILYGFTNFKTELSAIFGFILNKKKH
jgi:hypothetical protein